MLGEGPEDEQNKSTDPRAYPNKSVGARMAIISAGVIMNIFLGLACFVYAYKNGMIETPAKVGAVVPGSPAYRAGMRPGDEIVSIDGRRDISYRSLVLKVSLSGSDQVLRFGVQRPGQDGLIDMDIHPVREPNLDHPTIGIIQAEGLTLYTFRPPTGMLDPPSYPGLDKLEADEVSDTLVAAGPADQEPKPLASHEDYERILAANPRPIKHVIERRSASSGEKGPVRERFELTLPPAHVVDFGLRMTAEPTSAVRAGSLAQAADFRVGDRIVKVDGHDDLDPMQWPDYCRRNAGRPMTFEVERPTGDGGRKTLTITVTPDDSPPWSEPRDGRYLDLPGLGLCVPITTRVVAVKPDSPAARAGVQPGDVINSMTIKPSKATKGTGGRAASTDRAETLNFDDGSFGWVGAFWFLQRQPGLDVELVVNKASQPTPIRPEPIFPDWFYPSRGLRFLPLERELPPQPIASALRRGFDDTVDNILNIYATLRSLATRRVSPTSMGGVITISRVAFGAAQMGLTYLIHFLGMLSINLAVLNFLPIPPLDGGQMVFLVAEKVRGRPLPESALVAGTYLGLFLVLGLMIFVTFQDIFRLF
jgi:regulator of sigma E protease